VGPGGGCHLVCNWLRVRAGDWLIEKPSESMANDLMRCELLMRDEEVMCCRVVGAEAGDRGESGWGRSGCARLAADERVRRVGCCSRYTVGELVEFEERLRAETRSEGERASLGFPCTSAFGAGVGLQLRTSLACSA
jgi:hypothetical protein